MNKGEGNFIDLQAHLPRFDYYLLSHLLRTRLDQLENGRDVINHSSQFTTILILSCARLIMFFYHYVVSLSKNLFKSIFHLNNIFD